MKKNRTKILFLCAQPAGYLFDCIASIDTSIFDIDCLYLSSDPLAPFDLSGYNNIRFKEIDLNCSNTVISEFTDTSPELVIVAGWSIKPYLQFIRKYKDSFVTVMMMDTPWRSTLKQRIFQYFFKLWLKKYFNYIWVAGEPQSVYARRLGFEPDQIRHGVYTTNHKIFQYNKSNKEYGGIKTLLFAGRLVDYKGLRILKNAWNEIDQDKKKDWRILIVGSGPLEKEMKSYGFEVRPFVQTTSLSVIMGESHAFYLGSNYENWGVSVHDAAACGLPLILSSGVQSGTALLEHKENGFQFKAEDATSLKDVLSQLFLLSNYQIEYMSEVSYKKSLGFNIENWLQTLYSFLDHKNN